jgi:TolB-like protein
MASLLHEIKRRKVFQVAVVYAVVAWVLIQIAATVEAPLQLPQWFDTAIIVFLLVGFPVALILAWIYELSDAGLKRTATADSSDSAESSLGAAAGSHAHEAATSAPGAAASATSGVSAAQAFELSAAAAAASSAPVSAVSGRQAALAATAAATPRDVSAQSPLPNSIAVLPFENMSPDPDNAYFAAGIHEEILNSLAKLKSLHVIARTSVLQYAGAQQPIAEIAGALGVGTIMEGSVRYAGKRVRVTTQLIDAQTGGHLWSEVYEREFDDIFAIQTDIAIKVADAMRAELTRDEKLQVEAPATKSTAAYALYLQVLSELDNSGEAAGRAHKLLDRAIELDPDFGLAHGAKAGLYGAELINTTATVAGDAGELGPLIRNYAGKALASDPDDSNAHVALCVLAEFTWHWTEARPHALQALESPRWGVLVAAANWTLSWSGDHGLAIDRARHMQRLNPTDWSAAWNLGIVFNYAGRYDEAAEALGRAIAIQPAIPIHHSWLAVTEVVRGNRAAARREIELTETLLGEHRPVIYLLDLGYTYGRLGDADNARRLFDEIQSRAAGQEIGAGGLALAHLSIGEHEEALEYLRLGAEKAARHEIDAGMFSLMNLKANFVADPVLEQPEFVAIRQALRGD